ncbi:hypothetical protein P8C59_001556 [Phyllachora maydis]|uniref:F-box domain-containing protein n=1 Tax=Phyllachora maydis TaxID=1825666 RepID=A0AAD9HZS1_9PEZI|nr:hypothetical protein P8C59_001556 [Phyllachora maydis]
MSLAVADTLMFLDHYHDDDDDGGGNDNDKQQSPALRMDPRPQHHHPLRPDRAQLAAIMTTTSNPVSPGPPSPPLVLENHIHRPHHLLQDFVPPARPSSTPFPQPHLHRSDMRCTSCPMTSASTVGDAASSDMDVDTDVDMDVDLSDSDADADADAMEREPVYDPLAAPYRASRLNLNDLPAEIHECVLDHLFGFRVSVTSKSSITRWGTALRHSRRRELSELALVSRVWRVLIQERLYRHIKLQASLASLDGAAAYFAAHPHVRDYIRHLEIWFPVFQPRHGPPMLFTTQTAPQVDDNSGRWWPDVPPPHVHRPATALPIVTTEGLTSTSYVLPSDNAALEEVFYFVAETLPAVQVLTLEGGERKKAPKVRHWVRDAPRSGPSLRGNKQLGNFGRPIPPIASVRTLVCKGQWNLIRSAADFDQLTAALPGLTEWHALYSKPKSKSYLTMGCILAGADASSTTTGSDSSSSSSISAPPSPLQALTRLHLCLEGDYRREGAVPPFFLKVAAQTHFCSPLAVAAAGPALEHFSYTGRVCRAFFTELAARRRGCRAPRLRSVDLTVKNCCRMGGKGPSGQGGGNGQEHGMGNGGWAESGSGITNMHFIRAFEALVVAGIRALEVLEGVEYLRIRYVDLDSPVPPLNPYFIYRDGCCTGLWSDAIVGEMARVRPAARFEQLSESFGEIAYNKDGRMTISPDVPKSRAMSLKVGNYALLSGGVAAT